MTPKEVRQKWVAALRSDEYEQTQNALHNEDGYCCLGVLCDLYAQIVADGEWLRDWFLFSSDGHRDEFLPDLIREWAGLSTRNGAYVDRHADGREPMSLAVKNDSGASFDEIANIIESEPEGLLA